MERLPGRRAYKTLDYPMKTYSGPVSDHFDGVRFFDPDGVPPRSLREVLRWQFSGARQRATWPICFTAIGRANGPSSSRKKRR